eukprot:Skav208770  [mRNA]  locus=scaffold2301:20822:26640:+ [translate_table: standard]
MGCKGSKNVAPRCETRAEPEDRKETETTETLPMEEVEQPHETPVPEETKVESESFLEEKDLGGNFWTEPAQVEPIMEEVAQVREDIEALPALPETKRGRGHSDGDEETVTTALPREDETPRNMEDKVEGAREPPLCAFCNW